MSPACFSGVAVLVLARKNPPAFLFWLVDQRRLFPLRTRTGPVMSAPASSRLSAHPRVVTRLWVSWSKISRDDGGAASSDPWGLFGWAHRFPALTVDCRPWSARGTHDVILSPRGVVMNTGAAMDARFAHPVIYRSSRGALPSGSTSRSSVLECDRFLTTFLTRNALRFHSKR